MQDESFFSADLGGATVAWLRDACNQIVQLHVVKEIKQWTEELPLTGGKSKTMEREEETGKMIRRLRTMYHQNYDSGLRSEDPTIVPEFIEAHSPKEMYKQFMAVLQGIKKEGK